jgi:2-polyprenyl-3-methyl-5-hydroxy-6-metoxy-1,4-benzoquinol methylase
MNAPKAFYDEFATKLVRDFLAGNPRIESAISFASYILKKEKRMSVLDLGCGIGWSTYEFSRACPGGFIQGLDLSSNLIGLAKRMFPENEHRQYTCGDLTEKDWSAHEPKKYDACVMLDVYEHIPKASRSCFHEAISLLLSDDALLILTCPTTLHQAFLRNKHSEGLQPVDEDVTIADLQKLAEQVSAEITHFEYISIWATNDYFHAVLNRKVARKDIGKKMRSYSLLPKSSRMKHVQMAAELLGEEAMAQFKAVRPSLLKRAAIRLRRAK